MNNDIETRLEKVFRETLGLERVPAELSQSNSPAWDSVGHLNLILALEAEFGVFFEPEEIAALRTLADVRAALEKKSGKENATGDR